MPTITINGHEFQRVDFTDLDPIPLPTHASLAITAIENAIELLLGHGRSLRRIGGMSKRAGRQRGAGGGLEETPARGGHGRNRNIIPSLSRFDVPGDTRPQTELTSPRR